MFGTFFSHGCLCDLLPIESSLTIVDVHDWCVSTVWLWFFLCVSTVEGIYNPPPHTHTPIAIKHTKVRTFSIHETRAKYKFLQLLKHSFPAVLRSERMTLKWKEKLMYTHQIKYQIHALKFETLLFILAKGIFTFLQKSVKFHIYC